LAEEENPKALSAEESELMGYSERGFVRAARGSTRGAEGARARGGIDIVDEFNGWYWCGRDDFQCPCGGSDLRVVERITLSQSSVGVSMGWFKGGTVEYWERDGVYANDVDEWLG
jgi:hypothetical protein